LVYANLEIKIKNTICVFMRDFACFSELNVPETPLAYFLIENYHDIYLTNGLMRVIACFSSDVLG